ncbi:orotidine-5'-phosphate decarboxylase [Actinopolymorpha sp. B17G11]|uniref:orotidine-5'-phosphate decarboxylase n=1 Tax=Actinopolymorpha sp. B17G11 TaxID=3160861 RepID=UPI0032E4F6A0
MSRQLLEEDRTVGSDVTPFGTRLRAAMDARGPLCAGIDPHPSLLAAWGLSDDPSGLERFALTATEALAPQVSMVKPQSAFFERHGSRGIAVLEQVIALSREAGAIVLLDGKRGDIGSTVRAYADAYLEPSSPLFVDAVTAHPYLGYGSLRPFFDSADRFGCGVFVLALTSNPEGPEVQAARQSDGRTVAGSLLDRIAAANAGADPLGSVGAVVGATVGETGEDFARLNGPILAPGFGAQGGTAADLKRIFGAGLPHVLPATSRGLLQAGPSMRGLREAAARTAGELAAVLT